jgi:hypothetical protein
MGVSNRMAARLALTDRNWRSRAPERRRSRLREDGVDPLEVVAVRVGGGFAQ